MDPSFTIVVLGTEGSSRSLIWARIPTRCTAHHCILPLPHRPSRPASVSTLHVAEPAGQYHSLCCSGRPFLITDTLNRCMTSCASLTGASPSRSVFLPRLGGLKPCLCRTFIFSWRIVSKAISMDSLLLSCALYVCARHTSLFCAALHEPDWAHIHVSTEVSVILQKPMVHGVDNHILSCGSQADFARKALQDSQHTCARSSAHIKEVVAGILDLLKRAVSPHTQAPAAQTSLSAPQ